MAVPSPAEPGQVSGPAIISPRPGDVPSASRRRAAYARSRWWSSACSCLPAGLRESQALTSLGLEHGNDEAQHGARPAGGAVCLLCSRTGRPGRGAWPRSPRRSRCSTVLAHLCEYALGVDLGIDQALFRDSSAALNPGRMAPNSAIALVAVRARCAARPHARGQGVAAQSARRRGARDRAGVAGRRSHGRQLAVGSGVRDTDVGPRGSRLRVARYRAAHEQPGTGLGGAFVSSGPGGRVGRRLLPLGRRSFPRCWPAQPPRGDARTVRLTGRAAARDPADRRRCQQPCLGSRERLDRRAAVRRSAVAELRESESRFRDTFENATVGMALEDETGSDHRCQPRAL